MEKKEPAAAASRLNPAREFVCCEDATHQLLFGFFTFRLIAKKNIHRKMNQMFHCSPSRQIFKTLRCET